MPETPARPPLPDVLSIDPDTVESAVLRRLIAEVQQEVADPLMEPLRAYDRVHNRYNRGPRGGPYNRVHNRHNRGR